MIKVQAFLKSCERLFSCVLCGLLALPSLPWQQIATLCKGIFSFPALNMFVIEIADLFCRFGL
jgi:hypothetical protein